MIPAVALTDAGVVSSPEEAADVLRIVPPIEIDCRLLQVESRLELGGCCTTTMRPLPCSGVRAARACAEPNTRSRSISA